VIPNSAKNSAHKFGCAADFHVVGEDITDTVRWIIEESGLDYDQVIDETRGNGRWVHLGMLRPGYEVEPRHQALVIEDGVPSVWVG
jgi:hypothetical protein